MKVVPILLSLVCTIPTLTAAADDYDCVGRPSPSLPRSAYQLRETLDQNLATLRKHFSDRGKLVNITTVLNSANHGMHPLDPADFARKNGTSAVPASVYRWPTASEGFNDMGTLKWIPQGITSSSDALQVGLWEERDVWLVSWYDKTEGKRSVRITFIDRATMMYRHVLFVVPNTPEQFTGQPTPPEPATDFKRLGVHAGGIVWYGHTLWVVDTTRRIRVFDLNNIWQVETGTGVGKMANGLFSAQDYRYVIPQIRSYQWTPNISGKPFRHSWVSLDREGTDNLLVGEYVSEEEPTDIPIRFVKYELDYTTRKLHTTSQLATASWAYCVNITEIQGAISHGPNKFYISTSNQDRGMGDLWTWTPGKLAKPYNAFLPRGPEDMTWENSTQTFTTLTEYDGSRYIVTYRASQAPMPA